VPDLTTSDGVRLHYEIDGPESAPPVVLLHGLGSDARADQPLVDAIDGRLHTVRLDLRGHGASEPLADPERYGWFGRAASDVVELLEVLGLDVVALQGGSLGAAVATATVLEHPARVRALGLSGPAIGAGPAFDNPVAAAFADGVAQHGLVGLLDLLTEGGILAGVTEEELASARENYARQHDDAMRACVAALAKAQLLDDLDELGAIECPTLVVARRDDPLHPFELGHELAQRIPGARFVKDGGAVPLYLRPRDHADLLVGFHRVAAERASA
jgi:3-oxoadipate enol-lactonase/4-carboxymuconolactone decarboxylase